MMALPDYGFVLLALSKTASTSLERTLAPYASLVISSPPGMKHLGASGFERKIAPRLAESGHERGSYEVVTMFRDPVSWLESWWRYRARDGQEERRPDKSTAAVSFEDYARSYIAGDRRVPTPRGRPAKFITVDGLIGVDRILAVERPDVWQAYFSERLGRPLEFERRNVSTAPVRGELTDATRDALREHLAPECTVWERLAGSGEWAGARGTPLAVPGRA
ncbi:hypothetical protein [Nocardioides allogilvus]|uniref:hypothetical protein n=1 Tax=Nocardioides allogilvus TaxID=2072017 RepID=UPI0013006F60|nr:hypothetical protein [Nocardioides allogilvus]